MLTRWKPPASLAGRPILGRAVCDCCEQDICLNPTLEKPWVCPIFSSRSAPQSSCLAFAYAPVVSAAVARSVATGQDLVTAGQVVGEDACAGLCSYSAHHAMLWISEWPRALIYPGFLSLASRSDGVAQEIRMKMAVCNSDAMQCQRVVSSVAAFQSAGYPFFIR